MDLLILCIYFLASMVPETWAEQKTKPNANSLPELIIMKKPENADSKEDSSVLITSDSASIVSPPVRTIIRNQIVDVEIVPRCKVDSVKFLLRHSQMKVDTIGISRKSPYKISWDPTGYPDQDQLHLQFGYVLYQNTGLQIVSPPMPHRWVLDRDPRHSRKEYNCFQITDSGKIKIDGDLSDWGKVRKAKLGNTGFFQLLWTGSHFLISAQIYDESITYSDFLEVHFDIYNDKNHFASNNHRSIRFGPKSRSNSFTVQLTDSGFILNDSINILLSQEMKWTRSLQDYGYIIETSIPLFTLSDLQFPSLKFGFDITVVNIDEGKEGKVFTSWSGSSFTNRYNPSQWGSVKLNQAMFPLKLTLAISAIFICLAVLFMVFLFLRQSRDEYKFEQMESKGYSDLMNSILDTVIEKISTTALTAEAVSSRLGITPKQVIEETQKEVGCSFEHLIEFQRIKTARTKLKDSTLTIEEIAVSVGFKNVDEFRKSFVNFSRTEPQAYRERAQKEAEEEDADNL